MKKWFYSRISLIWLVTLCVLFCSIYCVLYKTVGQATAYAIANILMIIEIILAPIGMIALGIWGENKLKALDEG